MTTIEKIQELVITTTCVAIFLPMLGFIFIPNEEIYAPDNMVTSAK